MRCALLALAVGCLSLEVKAGTTRVGISGENFLINGQLTYSDIPTSSLSMRGLLFNVRAVNATFDDLQYKTGGLPAGLLDDPGNRPHNNNAGYGAWSADANTNRFIAALPSWRAQGVLAVTLNFQGGCSCSRHGEQGVIWSGDNQTPNNNPFGANGTPINAAYLDRMARAINALDANGMVCILGLFYFGQDQRISNANDSQAIKAATDAVVDWVLANDWRNVLIEINNESTIGGYQHAILGTSRVHELFQRVKTRGVRGDGTRLLVSASSTGTSLPPAGWMTEADFFLPHGNGLSSGQITSLVNAYRNHSAWQAKPRPICFNEDSTSIANLDAAAAAHASWGLYDDLHHQSVWPANWTIWHNDDKAFFNRVAELVGLNQGADQIWIPAATYQPRTFTGAMTIGTHYTSDTSNPPDADPLADSLVGQCVFADTDVDSGQDWVEYLVNFPTTGKWYAWGRFYYPGAPNSDDPNSFYLRVDGGPEAVFGNEFAFRQWHWDGDADPQQQQRAGLNLGLVSAGQHTIRIRAREADRGIGPRLDMLMLTNNSACIPTDAQSCRVDNAGPHIESGGMVVVEAEHFSAEHANIENNRRWYVQDGVASGPTPDPDGFHAGAGGNAYIECLPDRRVHDEDGFPPGSFYDASPSGARVDYPITFVTPGTYRAWLRVNATGSEDNGAHIGVNGGFDVAGRRIQWCGGGWRWTNAQRDSGGTACGVNGTISINVPTAGTHLISLYQREDGAEIDRFILTRSTTYDPSGLGIGLPESPRTYPGIRLSTTAIDRTLLVGGTLPTDTFTVANLGAGTLEYTISDNVAWLAVSPMSGTSTGEADTITLSYTVAGLSPGTYTGVVTVAAPGAFNTPQHIVVRVTIAGPTIAINPASIQRTVIYGAALPPDVFTVANVGPNVLNYTITEQASWLSVSPASGASAGEADPILLTYDLTNLGFGQHAAQITVVSPDAGNSPQSILVTVAIVASRADFDKDGDVDQSDFGHFQACMSGSGILQDDPLCENARLDADEDVDQSDFAVFQECMNGTNVPADPACRG